MSHRGVSPNVSGRLPRALLLYGGWQPHEPEAIANAVEAEVLGGFDVHRETDLRILESPLLREFNLVLPLWTFGELPVLGEQGLLSAVENGLGLLAIHGAASAFLTSRPHKHLLGGQFVGHPAGAQTTYQVTFRRDEPLVQGLSDFVVTSEQYYLLVDPAVRVLATTTIQGGTQRWLTGVQMPVAWTRVWGDGRVFYCSLGHDPTTATHPTVVELLRRAACWAAQVVDTTGSLAQSPATPATPNRPTTPKCAPG
jgi:uncharacterized protein